MSRTVITGGDRYHSLDALRAAMMLLGLVLHSAASYTQTPLGWAWPYHDRSTSVVFDLTIFFIHLFRMPVFFVVAGFFAALLYHRDGAAGFARNRARRVALPLVTFWGVMIPLVGYGFIWSVRRAGGEMPWGPILSQPLYRQPILGHLWFLYYLLIYYAASLAIARAVRRVPRALDLLTERGVRCWWGPLLLAAATTVTLLRMQAPGLDTAPSILPPLRVLVAYGVFFGFGWLLFRRRDLVGVFADRWKSTLAIGAAASAIYLFVVVGQKGFASARAWHLTAIPFAASAIWFLIFGITGFFVRYLSKPRPVVRYFSDASYWMYLTHVAPAAWLPGVLARSSAPAGVKFLLVVGLTTVITAVTYHYFVRSTVVGELLNGRRQSRTLAGIAKD